MTLADLLRCFLADLLGIEWTSTDVSHRFKGRLPRHARLAFDFFISDGGIIISSLDRGEKAWGATHITFRDQSIVVDHPRQDIPYEWSSDRGLYCKSPEQILNSADPKFLEKFIASLWLSVWLKDQDQCNAFMEYTLKAMLRRSRKFVFSESKARYYRKAIKNTTRCEDFVL